MIYEPSYDWVALLKSLWWIVFSFINYIFKLVVSLGFFGRHFNLSTTYLEIKFCDLNQKYFYEYQIPSNLVQVLFFPIQNSSWNSGCIISVRLYAFFQNIWYRRKLSLISLMTMTPGYRRPHIKFVCSLMFFWVTRDIIQSLCLE